MPPQSLEVFQRQIIMPDIGPQGQLALARATVGVVGAGGLDFPVLSYLAAAGVGNIKVIDSDSVNMTNLNRQLFYTSADVGAYKSPIAAEQLSSRFPSTQVVASVSRMTAKNVGSLLEGCTIVIDAVDNLESRYVLSRWAVTTATPVVFGAVEELRGAIYVYDPGLDSAPCYECVFPRRHKPQTNPIPILGATAGIVGSWQAAEAIMYLCNHRHSQTSLIHIDIKHATLTRRPCARRADCFCQQGRS